MPEFARSAADRRLFDRAVVYFNHGAFFEAHEDWETLWREARGTERRRLQGLIQVAAAFVHFDRGFYASGFVRLLRQGSEKVGSKDEVAATEGWPIDLIGLLCDLDPWFAHASRVATGADLQEGAPRLPIIRYVPGVEPDPALPGEEGDACEAG